MRDALMISDVFFVTILQGWVYKTHQTCEMHASNQTLFFVTTLQGWAYKHNKHARCIDDRLIFFVTILQVWAYKTQPRSFFVAILQEWVYKTQTYIDEASDAMCCFSGMLWCFLCNNMARMVYKTQQPRPMGCIDDRQMFFLYKYCQDGLRSTFSAPYLGYQNDDLGCSSPPQWAD